MTAVVTALNGNIMFGENIPGQEVKLQFVYNSASEFPKIFRWALADTLKPVEVRLCSATEDGIPISIAYAWSYTNGTISFSTIFKVTSSGVAPLTKGASYVIIFRGQP